MDLVCGGYFLTKRGPRGRRNGPYSTEDHITLSTDHTDFFPSTMVLEWAADTEHVADWADSLGIAHARVPSLMAQMTKAFDEEAWLWPNVIPSVDAARRFHALVDESPGWLLLAYAVEASLVDELLARNAPPPQLPGFAPKGAGGVYLMLREREPLAPGYTVLGFDTLSLSHGLLTMSALDIDLAHLGAYTGTLNEHGLLPDFDSARRAAAIASATSHTPAEPFTPALIASYALQK